MKNYLAIIIGAVMLIVGLSLTFTKCSQKEAAATVQYVTNHAAVHDAIDSTHLADNRAKEAAIDSALQVQKKEIAKHAAKEKPLADAHTDAMNAYHADSTAQNKKCNAAISTCEAQRDNFQAKADDCSQALKLSEEKSRKLEQDTTTLGTANRRKDTENKQLAKATVRNFFEKNGIYIGAGGAVVLIELGRIAASQ